MQPSIIVFWRFKIPTERISKKTEQCSSKFDSEIIYQKIKITNSFYNL